MDKKWNYEIIINGELDYQNYFTIEQIQKISDFISKIEREG